MTMFQLGAQPPVKSAVGFEDLQSGCGIASEAGTREQLREGPDAGSEFDQAGTQVGTDFVKNPAVVVLEPGKNLQIGREAAAVSRWSGCCVGHDDYGF